MLRLLPLCVLLLPSVGVAQNTWYVPDDFSTIQAGIDGSANGDTVIVRDGTWVENINFRGKGITLKSENGPTAAVIDGSGSGTVVTFENGEGSDSVFKGFMVTNGLAGDGGGVHCFNSSSPTLDSCAFVGNDAQWGGGIHCNNSSPTLEGCTFTGNTAYDGGGIHCFNSSAPTLENCTFTNNSAVNNGGGMFCDTDSNPTLTLEDCTFAGNTAGNHGGGTYCNNSWPTLKNCVFTGNESAATGGGVFCSTSSPTLENCTFTNNTAYVGGGGMSCKFSSSPTLEDCLFTYNTAPNGGGLYCEESSPLLDNCTFENNTAGSQGGGVKSKASSGVFNSCTFAENEAPNGAGMYCSVSTSIVKNCVFVDNSAEYSGGGIVHEGSLLSLDNCSFTGNTANFGSGGGLDCRGAPSPTLKNCTFEGNSTTHFGGGMRCSDSSPTLESCIFWGNSAGQGENGIFVQGSQSNPIVTYSNVEGGAGEAWFGLGCIDADPLFVDPANGDFHLQQDPCQPGVVNPCVDAGDPADVPSGSTRTDGVADSGVVDMGFHYIDVAPPPPDADADDDGLLDLDEFSIYWTDPGLFDTDGDGLCDGQELGVTNATAPPETDLSIFQEDKDPLTTTDPLNPDTDGGGVADGIEDWVSDGWFMAGLETDPNNPLDDDIDLEVSSLHPRVPASFDVTDARPGALIYAGYSLAGPGPFMTYLGLEVALTPPIKIIGSQLADATTGSASWTVDVPARAPVGLVVYFQAVESAFFGLPYRTSNPVTKVVQ